MRLMSHPLRLDADGQIVTIEDGSKRHAAELAGIVLNTYAGERPLAPEYGIQDPIGGNVSAETLAAAVTRSEPELNVTAIDLTTTDAGTAKLSVAVEWAE